MIILYYNKKVNIYHNFVKKAKNTFTKRMRASSPLYVASTFTEILFWKNP